MIPQRDPAFLVQQQVEKIKGEPMGSPCATVYVQNLNEKIKVADLKNSLFQLFSQVGEVHEVHAKANIRMRGQAFVVAHDETIAETMIKELRAAPFYGKPLRLTFAKKDSDVIAKMKGTFEPSVLKKRKAAQQQGEKVRELKMKRKMIDKVMQLRAHSQRSQFGGSGQQLLAGPGRSQFGTGFNGIGQPERYKILFVEKIPPSVTQDKLEDIFGAYNGFLEVRLIAEKGVAFVEYLQDDYAAYALQDVKTANLLRFEDPETGLRVEAKINFGKR